MAGNCLHILQKSALYRLQALTFKIGKMKNGPKKFVKSQQFWSKFLATNKRIITICHHIEECSQYWRPFLTAYFLENITVQCYMTYVSFFVDIPFLLRYLFLYGDIEFNISLFLLINSCTRVVRLNRRFEVENRKLYLLFLKTRAIDRKNIGLYLKVILF